MKEMVGEKKKNDEEEEEHEEPVLIAIRAQITNLQERGIVPLERAQAFGIQLLVLHALVHLVRQTQPRTLDRIIN